MQNIKLIQKSRNEWKYGEIKFIVRSLGSKPNMKSWSGAWKYSPQHLGMMPHKEVFNIIKVSNGKEEIIARNLFEGDIRYKINLEIKKIQNNNSK